MVPSQVMNYEALCPVVKLKAYTPVRLKLDLQRKSPKILYK